MNRFSYLFIGFLLISVELTAQERIGLRLDNYQGINSIFLNPANSSSQKLNWNLNLVSTGFFAQTNYGFYENSSISNLWNKTTVNRPGIGENATPDLNEFVVLDYDNTDGKKFAEFNAFLTGPSFMAHLDNHHFGAFINYRVHAAEQNLDQDFGYYTNRRIPITDSIEVDRTKISGMLWREIGGHYAYSKETNFGKISIGGNLKYLSGIEGIAFETTRTSELKRLSVDELSVEALSMNLVGTRAIIEGNDDFGKRSKGSGFGGDIGVTLSFEDYVDDYKLKVGLAINDIGNIKFDRDVERHSIASNTPTIFNKQDYLELSGIQDLISRASNSVLNDPTASFDLATTSFKLGLPTSIVLNADYRVMDNVYVGAVFVQRFPKTKVGLEKSNLLAIAPRYESKWIGASLPVTMTNYHKTHVGMSVRLAYLTLGTDQIGTLGTQKKLSSGDFYLSLQFFGFQEDGIFNQIFQKRGKKSHKCYEM